MVRPLRIEYPGAWYHVMTRGRRREQIFLEERDYQTFLDLLMESVELWNLRIAAYCHMPNHYHLIVQTPDANLSPCMRHINGVYTQRFNRRHGCDGQLFRGRYKSILVDADSYLLQLVKYIHRNPLRAGQTDKVDRYVWSSHKGYISRAKKWDWLHKEFVLSMFSEDKTEGMKSYSHFVAMEDSEEITNVFQKKRWPSVLGTEDFVNSIRKRFFVHKADDEVPQSKELAPDSGQIKQAVCQSYGINETELLVSRRGVFNEPRNVGIYLMRRLRGESLRQIAEQFQMRKYSSVSSVIERMKAFISNDRKLRLRVESLISELSKSQEHI
jgi:REP element-mobilizing transposase RayT